MKQAFCRCGGEVATVYWEYGYRGFETIVNGDPPDACEFENGGDIQIDWKYESDIDCWQCMECKAKWKSQGALTDAINLGEVVLRDVTEENKS